MNIKKLNKELDYYFDKVDYVMTDLGISVWLGKHRFEIAIINKNRFNVKLYNDPKFTFIGVRIPTIKDCYICVAKYLIDTLTKDYEMLKEEYNLLLEDSKNETTRVKKNKTH